MDLRPLLPNNPDLCFVSPSRENPIALPTSDEEAYLIGRSGDIWYAFDVCEFE